MLKLRFAVKTRWKKRALRHGANMVGAAAEAGPVSRAPAGAPAGPAPRYADRTRALLVELAEHKRLAGRRTRDARVEEGAGPTLGPAGQHALGLPLGPALHRALGAPVGPLAAGPASAPAAAVPHAVWPPRRLQRPMSAKVVRAGQLMGESSSTATLARPRDEVELPELITRTLRAESSKRPASARQGRPEEGLGHKGPAFAFQIDGAGAGAPGAATLSSAAGAAPTASKQPPPRAKAKHAKDGPRQATRATARAVSVAPHREEHVRASAAAPAALAQTAATAATAAVPVTSSVCPVLVDGDGVVVSFSAGVPVVCRTAAARASNPERLSLDRRCLDCLPIIECEPALRLLSLQHNQISGLNESLAAVRKLVFLDLYNNRVSDLSGLSLLSNLRVLMLGRNQISHIPDLRDLLRLDVLDLHGNLVSELGENLCSLSALRVLNLASNRLRRVPAGALRGLAGLAELNLRRNKISALEGLEELPALRNLFASSNALDLEGARSALRCRALCELALDSNDALVAALGGALGYRRSVLSRCGSAATLRMLDLLEVTPAERLEAQRCGPPQQDEPQHNKSRAPPQLQSEACTLRRWAGVARQLGDAAYVNKATLELLKRRLEERDTAASAVGGAVERHGGCLTVLGAAYQVLDEELVRAASEPPLDTVVFEYSLPEELAREGLPRLAALPGVSSVMLSNTQMRGLADLGLVAARLPASVRSLSLRFCKVTSLELYRPWLALHCQHVAEIDGVPLSSAERDAAAQLFGPVLGRAAPSWPLHHSMELAAAQRHALLAQRAHLAAAALIAAATDKEQLARAAMQQLEHATHNTHVVV
jgi:hypothetical protein